MSDRLPPLTALRAFEAAARHLSFARAADELAVTPAALSFQIKQLEADLGVPVFRRLNRAIELTEVGRALLPGARDGFAALRAGWAAARRAGGRHGLTVTAGPGFTSKWLAPRLFGFARAHPDVELRLAATLRLMEFGIDDIDVAIRFDNGSAEGMHEAALVEEWLAPMAVPEVAARLKEPSDLLGETLIHTDDAAHVRSGMGWPMWFRAAGLGPAPQGGPRFSQSDHATDAALSGGGVILGRYTMAETALAAGRLVIPFGPVLRSPTQYRVLCARGDEERSCVRAFLGWLRDEAAAMHRPPDLPPIVDP